MITSVDIMVMGRTYMGFCLVLFHSTDFEISWVKFSWLVSRPQKTQILPREKCPLYGTLNDVFFISLSNYTRTTWVSCLSGSSIFVILRMSNIMKVQLYQNKIHYCYIYVKIRFYS